jgi:hypothetical protein
MMMRLAGAMLSLGLAVGGSTQPPLTLEIVSPVDGAYVSDQVRSKRASCLANVAARSPR